ncbi:MAG: hypothetical protein Aurels2KO_11920 [Aureliella sp.]
MSKRQRSSRRREPVAHPKRVSFRGPALMFAIAVVVGGIVVALLLPGDNTTEKDGRDDALNSSTPQQPEQVAGKVRYGSPEKPRFFDSGQLTMVWDSIRSDVVDETFASKISNIAPEDYVGPDKCVECHAENHAEWSEHPHRWMNAIASAGTVVGDFSGEKTIDYRGGVGRFTLQDGEYRMSYERDDLKRSYVITQTIGSRFYQYYIGRGLEGPEPKDHDYYSRDHVLPFGYWIDREEWVPIVHVADEAPDGERWESVETVKAPVHLSAGDDVGVARGVDSGKIPVTLAYAHACNYCHTTFALGDLYVRLPQRLGKTVPEKTFFALSKHVEQSHSVIWDGSEPPEYTSGEGIEQVTAKFIAMEAKDDAATLGVSCEACHLGCREHVENPKFKPPMIPLSPNLRTYDDPHAADTGRTAANINVACSRCHAGGRPTYAAGMATWNSTEHSDAMRGSCYSKLSCAHCHDPHKAIGKSWPKTPEQDDASCISCHQQFSTAKLRQQHTHHAPGSMGDRCMNCHMPKINEGMQDVVRTHTIFSPTQADMIESNQPNACNLCHLDKSIDWTLEKLDDWYGKSYSPIAITSAYPSRNQPMGLGWLASDHEATRLVAAEAAARQAATWMMPAMANMLDDPYLLNRQFAQTNLEKLSSRDLNKEFGYWFYMTPEERRAPVAAIRKAVQTQVTQ